MLAIVKVQTVPSKMVAGSVFTAKKTVKAIGEWRSESNGEVFHITRFILTVRDCEGFDLEVSSADGPVYNVLNKTGFKFAGAGMSESGLKTFAEPVCDMFSREVFPALIQLLNHVKENCFSR